MRGNRGVYTSKRDASLVLSSCRAYFSRSYNWHVTYEFWKGHETRGFWDNSARISERNKLGDVKNCAACSKIERHLHGVAVSGDFSPPANSVEKASSSKSRFATISSYFIASMNRTTIARSNIIIVNPTAKCSISLISISLRPLWYHF